MSVRNPNPSSLHTARPTPPVTLSASPSMRLQLPINRRRFRVPKSARSLSSIGTSSDVCYLCSHDASLNRSFVTFAASDEESPAKRCIFGFKSSICNAGIAEEALGG